MSVGLMLVEPLSIHNQAKVSDAARYPLAWQAQDS